MPVQSINNVMDLIVSNDNENHDKELHELAKGEAIIFNAEGGERVTSLSAVDKFKFAYGTGSGYPTVSDTIENAKIKKVTKSNFKEITQQLDYVGYNPVTNTGALDTLEDNTYMININVLELLVGSSDGRRVIHGTYVSGANTPTQYTVATELNKSLVGSYKKETTRAVKIERVNSGDETDADTSVTVDVIYNSTRAVVNSSSLPGGVAVGSLIRFGTTNAGPVYKIMDATTVGNTVELVLDMPYQGKTETIDSTDYEFVVAADIADFGIKLTGLPTDYRLGRIGFDLSKWNLNLTGFEDTTVYHAERPSRGSGDGRMVADIEYYTLGTVQQDSEVSDQPVLFDRHYATLLDEGYVIYAIQYINKDDLGIGPNPTSHKEIYVAIKANKDTREPVSTSGDALHSALDPLV